MQLPERSDMGNLPFGIDFVVEQDLSPLGYSKRRSNEGYTVNCPFCEKSGLTPDKHHKLAINTTINVAHCFRCNSGYNIIGLHSALCNLSHDEAKKDLLNRWNGLSSDVKAQIHASNTEIQERQKKKLYPAPIEYRDEIYCKLLNQLSLSDEHHDDLIRRGLTEEEIVSGGYRSVPVIGLETFASKCFSYETSKAIRNHREWGIPGFFDIKKEPKMVRNPSGYFIPVIADNGMISELQIRFDNPAKDAPKEEIENFAKYKPFTSDYSNKIDGCTSSGCENIHYAGDWSTVPDTCVLTEGILKANVASCLAGRLKRTTPRPFLAIDGVNKYQLLAFELLKLKDKGLKKVVVALDMDYREKPQVKNALDHIKEIISEVGLEQSMFTWDSSDNKKGIDDFLLALIQNNN